MPHRPLCAELLADIRKLGLLKCYGGLSTAATGAAERSELASITYGYILHSQSISL
ncbi:hypothetical protein J6590_012990, partial [Homalodisca vitripennis]